MNQKTSSANEKNQDSFSLIAFFRVCLEKWKWFLISVVCVCALAGLYILRQQPEYTRTMSLLIKDQDSGGGAADIASAFSSLGLVSSNTNVNNELITLVSPAVMQEVIERLHLQVTITEKGLFHGTTLYGATEPYIIDFPDLNPEVTASFRMDRNFDGSARLYKFKKSGPEGREKFEEEVTLRPGATAVNTPVGRVTFTPNPKFDNPDADPTSTLIVFRSGLQPAIEFFLKELKGDLADKDADVIDLSVTDVSIVRAVDILNNIIAVYKQDYVDDKNEVAAATSRFIDERLALIERELGTVDSDISEYKSKTLVPDLEEAAKINMRTTQDLTEKELEYTNQLAMAKYVRDYVNNPANADNVIPVNTGMGSNQLETQISTYNQTLLARNTLRASSSASNPLVTDYTHQLAGMHEAIIKAIGTQVATLEAAINNINSAKGDVRGQLASGPSQAKYLLSVERQQKVKESLYLYLLQKREENELTQKFTADNVRIITPPYGSFRPVSPKKGAILVVAFILGLAIPLVYLYIRETSNTKVRSRKDLDRMNAPFAGEIPYVPRKGSERLMRLNPFRKKKKKNKRELEEALIVVKSGSRDMANEAFRILRGNIDLMGKNSEASNVIMITSFNAASGKSFISFNLAASFAMKGKKVLIIDCDLRHGSTSQFIGMPSKGLTNYLRSQTDNWMSLLVRPEHNEDVAVLPVGHRPPNPAELLENGRIGTLIREASHDFDIVLVDCPPVDIVVDTQIMEKYVGSTIFVIRAGLLEKSSVQDVDELYTSARFKNMSIVLNGTNPDISRYGQYGSAYYGSNWEE